MTKTLRVMLIVILMTVVVCVAEFVPSGTVNGTVVGFSSVSSTSAWAATGSGYVYHYDGQTWVVHSNLAQSLDVSLEDIFALDDTHIWAVGYSYSPSPADGKIFYYDGAAWSLQASLTNATDSSRLYDVYASDTSHVWAVGNGGQIWATADGGESWGIDYDPDNRVWKDIDGCAENFVCAVGESSGGLAQICHWDGSVWSTKFATNLGNIVLMSVSVVSTNDAWAIGGTNGYVARYQDGLWKPAQGLEINNNQYWISRNTFGETWATVFGAGIFHLENGAWLQDTNRLFVQELDASPWFVWVFDYFDEICMLDLRPELDRMGWGIGLSWNSVPGREYTVEWTDDPMTQTWYEADRVIATEWTSYWGDIGDGTSNRPAPSASSQRTYRVVE